MNGIPERPLNELRRLRMLYSLGDFQLALSAAEFLKELDPDEPINKVMLRRYRCYETTLIISYGRPFSASDGIPRLSLKMAGVQLDSKEQALHNKIIRLRNKKIAHSDADMMRMLVKAETFKINGVPVAPYINPVFDEGVNFLDQDLFRVIALISKVHLGLLWKLYSEAEENIEHFNINVDDLYSKNT